MKPGKDVLAAHLAEEAVLLDLDSKRYYRLNDSAAVIYRALEAGEGRDGAIKRLLEKFEIDEPTASAAVDDVIKDLESRKLLDRTPPTEQK